MTFFLGDRHSKSREMHCLWTSRSPGFLSGGLRTICRVRPPLTQELHEALRTNAGLTPVLRHHYLGSFGMFWLRCGRPRSFNSDQLPALGPLGFTNCQFGLRRVDRRTLEVTLGKPDEVSEAQPTAPIDWGSNVNQQSIGIYRHQMAST